MDINEQPPSEQFDDDSSAQSLIINSREEYSQFFDSLQKMRENKNVRVSHEVEGNSNDNPTSQTQNILHPQTIKHQNPHPNKPFPHTPAHPIQYFPLLQNRDSENLVQAEQTHDQEDQAQENKELEKAPEIIHTIVQMEDNFVSFLDHTY